MDTSRLKKFAQAARRKLMQEVTIRLDQILQTQSLEHREKEQQITQLKQELNRTGRKPLIEKVAYTWFNRLVAFRFMDVNGYTDIGVVTPRDGGHLPQLLQEAKAGHIDADLAVDRERISAILTHRIPSANPQNEVYKMLLVAECNRWHQAMPFMFERINHYTELLMPDDLISPASILEDIRQGMTEEDCVEVEVIGWLYQFYIAEKKDEVFEGLKKNKKITPENIPAATQLFTPHWIVRYLVENSLGRLWMLNHPDSRLIEQMAYYIKPEQLEIDFLHIEKPEDIKICDPACGSGHMLTYAFDLLYAIYEEAGYVPGAIPGTILSRNLYGIEIDQRAGALAAFALTMKARARQRRFFRKPIQPNICVLENISFTDEELQNYLDFVGLDLFTTPLQTTMQQFEEADNFGSLIRPEVTDVEGVLRVLEDKDVSGHLFLSLTHRKVLQALRQAGHLSPKYHVVIANPPYMGGKGMNGRLAAWTKDNFPSSKSDLFAMFIERNLDLAQKHGAVAMITMQSWMFLSSFEALRAKLLGQNTLLSMAHLGARAFDSIGGEVVSTTAFVLENANRLNYKGGYLRLVTGNSEAEKNDAIREAVNNPDFGWLYHASGDDFKKIPGSPIAYWVGSSTKAAFAEMERLGDVAKPRQGMSTNDNERFLRLWFESSFHSIGFGYTDAKEAQISNKEWFPYNKGGAFRKWYGNTELTVNWKNDGQEIKEWLVNNPKDPNTSHWSRRIINTEFYFKTGITWTFISSNAFGVRFSPQGALFDVQGSSMFPTRNLEFVLAFLASKVAWHFLKILNPTVSIQAGNISALPWCTFDPTKLEDALKRSVFLIKQAKSDWDSYETSWGFTIQPVLNPDYRQPTLKATYQKLRAHWREMTLAMQRLEEENNHIFILAYGLQDELTPKVPFEEITLTCNPYYRYSKKVSDLEVSGQGSGIREFPIDEELEEKLLADTMRELVSYAVGCMFGRYSLDKPGLILASQGEGLTEYLSKVDKEPKDLAFLPDDDGIIPVLEGKWFEDDLAARFIHFLKVTFGEEKLTENLQFLENALGKDIRQYLVKEFYKDHVKRYKKRPIYWLFSSPQGHFNALIYLHRYQPDTCSKILNDYLRPFINKLQSQQRSLDDQMVVNGLSSSERNKITRELDQIKKALSDCIKYERDILIPVASKRISIDLDDGVLVNYNQFGQAVAAVPGLNDAKTKKKVREFEWIDTSTILD